MKSKQSPVAAKKPAEKKVVKDPLHDLFEKKVCKNEKFKTAIRAAGKIKSFEIFALGYKSKK